MVSSDFNVSKDSFLASGNPSTNYGNYAFGLYTLKTLSAEDRGIFEYDISSIPSDSVIISAILHFYVTEAEESRDFYFYRNLAQFTESTVTWSNQPSHTTTNNGTYSSDATTGWKECDITSLVQDAYNAGDYVGIKCMVDYYNPTGLIRISPKEHAAPTNASYITITYSTGYYVKTTGNDSNDGESWANAWATVNKAATTVPDGSTVHIGFGTYNAEPANNDIAPVNAGSVGIKYLPETETTGGGTGSVIVEVN